MDDIYVFKCDVDSEWCKNQINKIETKDSKDIFKFTHIGNFMNDKYIDIDFANEIFNLIPEIIKIKLDIKRPNNVIMTGSYNTGQSFGLHLDTCLFDNGKEKSTHTLLLYLNDDFEGGETEFFNDDFKHLKTFKPVKGHALLFDMKLWHLGKPVYRGTKHLLHIELISDYLL